MCDMSGTSICRELIFFQSSFRDFRFLKMSGLAKTVQVLLILYDFKDFKCRFLFLKVLIPV